MRAGSSEEKIRQVPDFRVSPHFDDGERAALELAEAMTITDRTVTDELVARVRRHFSEAQLVELAAAVALENFRSKFNVALGIEAQGFCVIDPRPLPAPTRIVGEKAGGS
jgi:alkylhydroperoxidase family enzyme